MSSYDDAWTSVRGNLAQMLAAIVLDEGVPGSVGFTRIDQLPCLPYSPHVVVGIVFLHACRVFSRINLALTYVESLAS